MCIICVKPKGVAMPPSTWIDNMWYCNHDGAGFMYADGKNVVIRKGYMTLKDFKAALDELGGERKLKDTAIVMHFRIGTAGGNIPANTHPFPVTDAISILQKLSDRTKLGVAHNGVIDITTRQKDISDTMEYIASELAPLYRYDNEFYRSKDLLQMISNRTTSKWAFMNPKGEIYTVGAFVEDGGCLFSNSTYNSTYYYRRVPTSAIGLPYSDDLYDDWNYNLYHGEYTDQLMLLNDDEYIVDEDDGEFYTVDEGTFFVDSDGFLYIYDEYVQCAMPIVGNYRLYNREGGEVKFNADAACDMLVMDDDVTLREYMKWYKGDGKDDKDDDDEEEDDGKKTPLPF